MRPGLQNNCEKTLLKKSEEHVCPPPFPKVELPLSNLSGGGTGGCSWGLDLQRNSSPEPCGKPRMAGGKVERGRQQKIHERYQKHQVEEGFPGSLLMLSLSLKAEAAQCFLQGQSGP